MTGRTNKDGGWAPPLKKSIVLITTAGARLVEAGHPTS
jgi:hypothetical protein